MSRTDAIAFGKDAQGIVTLTMDLPGHATNIMGPAFRSALLAVLERLEAERETVQGVILTSGKRTFFAGGDLHRLLSIEPGQARSVFDSSMDMKALMRRLELLGRPVVAAINGAALGGGFELCLACHARFCIDDASIQLGLPESSLGLLPGGGGIVRLVRMLGLPDAFPLLSEGTVFDPERAQQLALVDALATDREDLLARARHWIGTHPHAAQPWDRARFQVPGAEGVHAAPPAWLAETGARLHARYRGCYPAPLAVLRAAQEGAGVDFERACEIESDYLAQLVPHAVTKNLITTFFFQMKEVRKALRTPGQIVGHPEAFDRRITNALANEREALQSDGVPQASVDAIAWALDLRWPDSPERPEAAAPSALPDDDVRDRLLYAGALEGVRCLDDGTVASIAQANTRSVLHAAFPRWTGGVLQCINSIGLQPFVQRCSTLAARYGERWRAPARLVRMAEQAAVFGTSDRADGSA